MTAPAAVYTYNRLAQTQKTLEALDRNTLAPETDLYIFNDAYNPAKDGDQQKVDAVRGYLRTFRENSRFRSVTLILAEEHKGLAKSVIGGVDMILEKYDTLIVTEDDLVSHENYLAYMNEALAYYRDDPRIWSISGYSYPLVTMQGRQEVYFTYRGSSWGWATWKDRWQTVDWQMKRFPGLLFRFRELKKLMNAGRDLYIMLRDQKRGIIDSWAVRWVFAQTEHELMTVYPAQTFVHNIGLDGSGTHSGEDGNDSYDSLAAVPYTLRPAVYEPAVLEEFARYYEDPYFHTVQKYK